MKAQITTLLTSSLLLLTSVLQPTYADQGAKNIVVSGGSITEIIYALGEENRIVGVDSTSVFPVAATDKPQIGYVRKINVEGILSLNPDLLLGEADTGPDKVLKQLQDTGLPTYIFSDNDNLAGVEEKITTIAELLAVKDKGQALVEYIQADRKALTHVLKQVNNKPKVLFVLSLRSGQPIVAGAGNSADEVINAAGGVNVAAQHFDGWKPLATEAAIAMDPDVIISMGRHGEQKAMDLSQVPHFKFSNAVKNNRVLLIDGTYLLGMGPRTPQAVVELSTLLHPDATLPRGYRFRAAQSASKNESL
ncbi:heme/hemin ABC transporter substrate-binding protein [Pseudoalteromonas maricaloris]|uniref:ABC transporter substrate-binding protein n=1 Tax=Pseudoalteromonas maricaloris TaxID=184924 RepID=A0A8I2H0Y2_9GAMM|nr:MULTISPECIES: ABC transporter substrate-binding protein [Pseudoalteromonas]KID33795.1 hemin ABC transporter substrate-binding protein [Pseudoalteromonas flavipulchra NCIMB 2033 = ATCC BAA-314]MBD0782167.1 ABC transporter substrate-binding protein [Pseudoalteromonas flavipulchra]MBE0375886.1 iron complex transport system substrate-binding protein [Pseudoalteromonas flavipulchra NCIMB 2033 = ATCC BAA-314]NLR21003.1 ABC transporter substrate-binding protein [Pseudoalteromonas maricaloris]WOX30